MTVQTNKTSGLTLIELLLTVAIITVVGVLATGFYSRFLLQNSASNVQDEIIQEMRKAQSYAMSGKQNDSWGVYYTSHVLTLYKGATYATRTTEFDETFTFSPSITVSGLTEVNFARATGLPSATPTVTITGGGNSRTITVNSQGMATR